MGHAPQLYTTKELLMVTISDVCAREPQTLIQVIQRFEHMHILDAQKALYELESAGRVHVNSAGFISLPKKAVQ